MARAYLRYGPYYSDSLTNHVIDDPTPSTQKPATQFYFPTAGTLVSWQITHSNPEYKASSPYSVINYYLYKNKTGEVGSTGYTSTISLSAQYSSSPRTSAETTLGISVASGDYILVAYDSNGYQWNDLFTSVRIKFDPA